MADLVFGRDRDPQVVSALAGEKKKGSGALKVNPMLALGPGPLGKKCGTCSHLFVRGGVAGTYYKCDLRHNTGGAATDHRVRWPACARYEEVTK